MTIVRDSRMQLTAAFTLACMIVGRGAEPVELAPSAVVERVITNGERKTRLSLFSNRMAVVRVTTDGHEAFSNQLVLNEEDFMVYIGAVNRDAETIASMNFIPSAFEDALPGILRVRIEGRGLVELRYPKAALVELPMARLSAALDDLESLVMTTSASAEALREWEPRRGDMVELISGGQARVVEVFPEGLVRLEYIDVAVIEMVPRDSRARVIRRVLERPE